MRLAETEDALCGSLEHYPAALQQPVAAVFQCGGVFCCRLTNDLLLGGQFASEHENLEVLLGRIQDFPDAFRNPRPIPHPMQVLLKGRRFRGFVLRPDGNLGFNFGRYMVRFVQRQKRVDLMIAKIDCPDLWDLPEDSATSIQDQIEHASRLLND